MCCLKRCRTILNSPHLCHVDMYTPVWVNLCCAADLSPLHPTFTHNVSLAATSYIVSFYTFINLSVSFLSASRELGGTDKENNEDDCWWGPIHHRFPHHVWRLSVQWPHSHVNANVPLHQRV